MAGGWAFLGIGRGVAPLREESASCVAGGALSRKRNAWPGSAELARSADEHTELVRWRESGRHGKAKVGGRRPARAVQPAVTKERIPRSPPGRVGAIAERGQATRAPWAQTLGWALQNGRWTHREFGDVRPVARAKMKR